VKETTDKLIPIHPGEILREEFMKRLCPVRRAACLTTFSVAKVVKRKLIQLSNIVWLALFTLTVCSASLSGQDFVWTQTSAPSGGWTSVASSSDGTKLVAGLDGVGIYTSKNSGTTWTQSSVPTNRDGYRVASSSDGTKLVAGVIGGIYISTNSGTSWSQRSAINASSVASSSDGTKLVAVFDGGGIYTSTNSGTTWTQTSAPSAGWYVASSSDGTFLVAAADYEGGIYTSTNSGTTWIQTSAPSANWPSVASSSDGTKLVAVVGGGFAQGGIYTSTNSGTTWIQSSAPSNYWYSVASLSDGSNLVAVSGGVRNGGIYTATSIHSLKAYIDGQIAAGTSIVSRGPVTITLKTSFTNDIIGCSLDGSDPRSSSILYKGPFTLSESARLQAVAYKSDFSDSVEMDPVQITILPTLTVYTAGGGTVSIDPPSGPYFSNSIAQITAQPASGCTFLQWLGDASGTNPTTTVTMSRDKYVEAVFGTAVGIIVVGGGSVLADPPLPLHPFGSTVRFTAQPQTGNYFSQWGAAASGTNNPLNFVVSNATPSVAATFPALDSGEYALTVIESGNGHVTVSPYANTYSNGLTVRLTAVPDTGQNFVGWNGSATGNQTPLIVTVNSNEVITASFTKRPCLRVGTPLAGVVEGGFRLMLTGEFGAQYQILEQINK
jgi:hypothetical protein